MKSLKDMLKRLFHLEGEPEQLALDFGPTDEEKKKTLAEQAPIDENTVEEIPAIETPEQPQKQKENKEENNFPVHSVHSVHTVPQPKSNTRAPSHDNPQAPVDNKEPINKEHLADEYKKIELQTTNTTGFTELAAAVAANLQDGEWLKQLHTKAGHRVKDIADLRKVARSASAHLEDKEFVENLFLDILAKTRSKEEYVMYAQLSALFLRDKEFSKRVCKNIEIIFLPKKILEDKYKKLLQKIAEQEPSQGEKQDSPALVMPEIKKFIKTFKMNRHIKEIYFKAAKEFSAFDKIETLNAYVMYYSLSYKAGTKTAVIPVRVQKTLFKNPEEHRAFLEIVEVLKGDNQPGIALKKVIEGFSAGRKKITLDETKIAGIKTRHSQTAGKLGEILKD
ncbi:MAG: hypothetical protein GY757_41905, partial [bacterium]|nr:hypothetical protein [bacterium]